MLPAAPTDDRLSHRVDQSSGSGHPDCERIFGFFLHHFPYFGMRGEEDAADLHAAYDETIELYRAAFGKLPAGVWRPEDSMKCGRKACKPQKCK
jgi:hypothetical protein